MGGKVINASLAYWAIPCFIVSLLILGISTKYNFTRIILTEKFKIQNKFIASVIIIVLAVLIRLISIYILGNFIADPVIVKYASNGILIGVAISLISALFNDKI